MAQKEKAIGAAIRGVKYTVVNDGVVELPWVRKPSQAPSVTCFY